MKQYWETGDVAIREKRGPATVRADVDAGLLKVAAVTKRGTRLFLQEDVEEYGRIRRKRLLRRRVNRG